MLRKWQLSSGLLLVALVAAGCSSEGPAATTTAAAPARPSINFLLTEEPQGAIGIIAARNQAQHNEDLVVVGRIGGGINPWIEGRAAFLLVDPAAGISCDVECGEGCACHAEELVAATTLVKFVDDRGQVVDVDARELLGVKEMQLVVVRGKASRSTDGNLAVMANGIYIRR